MALFDTLRKRIGRKSAAPARDSVAYAQLSRLGVTPQRRVPLPNPTPANLRTFSRTPFCRKAINSVKNRVIRLEWKIGTIEGVKETPELERQIEIARACLATPNTDDSFRTLIEQCVEDYLVFGAGAYEQQMSSDPSRPLWMWPVDSQTLQIFPLWAGDPNEARYAQIIGFNQLNLLRNDELVYMRANPSTQTPYGYGPVEIAFKTISRLLGAQEYAGQVASNDAPANIIGMIGADQTAVDAFRAFWTNDVEGRGTVPIVGVDSNGNNGDLKVFNLHGGTDAALYLQYQQFLVREIAAAFDLSAPNLNMEEHQNKSTAEVADTRDMDSAVRPVATLLAAHLSRESIQGKLGFSQIEFKFEGLDAEDVLSMAETYKMDYSGNAMTPNEYRAMRNMPPMESEVGNMTYSEAMAKYGKAAVNNVALTT